MPLFWPPRAIGTQRVHRNAGRQTTTHITTILKHEVRLPVLGKVRQGSCRWQDLRTMSQLKDFFFPFTPHQ